MAMSLGGQLRRFVMMTGSAMLLAGCTSLLEIRDDIRRAKSEFTRVSGRVNAPACPACPTIVVALGQKSGKPLVSYRVYEAPGEFEIILVPGANYLFAFNDLNHDFEYQPNEPGGWFDLPDKMPGGGSITGVAIDIRPAERRATTWPDLGNLFDQSGHVVGPLNVQLGREVSLDDPRFEPDIAALGMWQPLNFVRHGYAGVYFLEPYSAGKTPVLFVHGIGGTPRDFALLISRLDRRRYQPWIFYYPSAFDIGVNGDGLGGIVNALRHRYRFKDLHLVAHSMGGLVSRSYLGKCSESRSCDFVRSFTSISSPFNGDSAASSGVEYSPVVMPVWTTLAPGSNFLNGLFKRPLPKQLPHHLLFSYRNTSLVLTRSGDETVPLTSQLRPEAQAGATAVRGFDETHMGILGLEEVSEYLNGVFAAPFRK